MQQQKKLQVARKLHDSIHLKRYMQSQAPHRKELCNMKKCTNEIQSIHRTLNNKVRQFENLNIRGVDKIKK